MITEEDFIDFTCPHCGEAVSFPAHQRGTTQECPLCFDSLIAPDAPGQEGRKIPVPFTTERLTLRRLAPGDWKDLLEIVSDEENFRYLPGGPMDEEAVLRWLETDANVKLTTPDQTFFLGLTLNDGGKLIGFVGLRLSNSEPRQGTVTVQINRAHQQNGYAHEGLEGLLRFCFEDLKLHRVHTSCDSRNAASIALFESAGLRREGEFVKETLLHGEWANNVYFAILREECIQSDT